MASSLAVQQTEQGLLLPRQLFEDLGEIEIVRRENFILIKPKNVTKRFKGFVRSRFPVETLHKDYELALVR